MKEIILIFPVTTPALKKRLEDRFIVLDSGPDDPAKLFPSEQLAKVRVVVCRSGGSGNMCKTVMDALPNLELLICTGSGFDGVDFATAKARGIQVANSVGANSNAVAELAMGLTLAVTRAIPRNDRFVRSGGWAAGGATSAPMGTGMAGTRIGIYGMGAIGRKIAVRAAAFESEVGYFSRHELDLPYAFYPSLEALAEWCQVLIVAVRADDSTKRSVNADVLKQLGPDGFVVNVTRGLVIDEDALIASLQSGGIAGAALDVFDNEPNIRPEFYQLENAILTPHSGPGTFEAMRNMHNCVFENLNAYFEGRAVPYPVPF